MQIPGPMSRGGALTFAASSPKSRRSPLARVALSGLRRGRRSPATRRLPPLTRGGADSFPPSAACGALVDAPSPAAFSKHATRRLRRSFSSARRRPSDGASIEGCVAPARGIPPRRAPRPTRGPRPRPGRRPGPARGGVAGGRHSTRGRPPRSAFRGRAARATENPSAIPRRRTKGFEVVRIRKRAAGVGPAGPPLCPAVTVSACHPFPSAR